MAALIHALSSEGPREVLIGAGVGVGVTLTLSWLGHRHIVKPMRCHHAEAMKAHAEHDRHLKAITGEDR